jgi:hypothetical protein
MTDNNTIEIRVDQIRLGDLVTVDQFIAMQEGNVRAIRDVLGCFVINGNGGYLDPSEGVKRVGALTFNQLLAAAKDFMGKADAAAVPLGSGKG